MVPIFINNMKMYVKKNSTVLQACLQNNIRVPSFCFHEQLNIAGNCRMCLVEIEKSPKPMVACALPITENMRIYTETPLVRKAREAVLEFLLINHPLDCPICDQGGECDLQDQTILFGTDRTRFYTYKRTVEDKNCGALIKTIMTRCIHCTRCVRFSTEISGQRFFGTTGRGKFTEIGTYIEKIFKSDISGNVIDLCPVGALTAKPYAFKARSWEYQSIEGVDFTENFGSNIKIDIKGNKIFRILPNLNKDLNEEWISDRIRFCFDGFYINRILNNFIQVFHEENKKFTQISLNTIYLNFFLNLRQKNLLKKNFNHFNPFLKEKCFIGSLFSIGENISDYNELNLLKEFFNKFFYTNSIFQIKSSGEEDFRYYFAFNSLIKNLKKFKVFFIVNYDLKINNPVLAAKLFQLKKHNNISIFIIGPSIFTYSLSNFTQLSLKPSNFTNILCGTFPFFFNFKGKKFPIIYILGKDFFFPKLENYNLIFFYQKLIKQLHNNKCLLELSILYNTPNGLSIKEIGNFPLNSFLKKNTQIKSFAYNINIQNNESFLNLNKNIKLYNIYFGAYIDSSLFSKNQFIFSIPNIFEKNFNFLNSNYEFSFIPKIINNLTESSKNLKDILSHIFMIKISQKLHFNNEDVLKKTHHIIVQNNFNRKYINYQYIPYYHYNDSLRINSIARLSPTLSNAYNKKKPVSSFDL